MVRMPHKTYSRRKGTIRRKAYLDPEDCFDAKKPVTPILEINETLPDDNWKDSFDKLKESKTPRTVGKKKLAMSPQLSCNVCSKENSCTGTSIVSTPIFSRSQKQLMFPISPITNKRKYFTCNNLYDSKGQPLRVFEYSSELASNVSINLSSDCCKNIDLKDNTKVASVCKSNTKRKKRKKYSRTKTENTSKEIGLESIKRNLRKAVVRITKMPLDYARSTSNIQGNVALKLKNKRRQTRKRKNNASIIEADIFSKINEMNVLRNPSKSAKNRNCSLQPNQLEYINLDQCDSIERNPDSNKSIYSISEGNIGPYVPDSRSSIVLSEEDTSLKFLFATSKLENLRGTLPLSKNTLSDNQESTRGIEVEDIYNASQYHSIDNGLKNHIDNRSGNEIDLLEANNTKHSMSVEVIEDSQTENLPRKQISSKILNVKKKNSNGVEYYLQSEGKLQNTKNNSTKNIRKLRKPDKKTFLEDSENQSQKSLQIEDSTQPPHVINSNQKYNSSNIIDQTGNCNSINTASKNSIDNSNIRLTKQFSTISKASTGRRKSDRVSFITLRKKGSNMQDNAVLSAKNSEVQKSPNSRESLTLNKHTAVNETIEPSSNLNELVGNNELDRFSFVTRRSKRIQISDHEINLNKDKSKYGNQTLQKSNKVDEIIGDLEVQSNISQISNRISCSNNISVKSIPDAFDKSPPSKRSNGVDKYSETEMNQSGHTLKEVSLKGVFDASKTKYSSETNMQSENEYCYETLCSKEQEIDVHRKSIDNVVENVRNVTILDISDTKRDGYKDNSIDRSIDRNEFISTLNKQTVSFNQIKAFAKNSFSRNSFKKGLIRTIAKSHRTSQANTIIYEPLHENIENMEDLNELSKSKTSGVTSIILQPGKWRKSLNIWRRNNSISEKINESKISSVRCDLSVNKSLMPIFFEAGNCDYSTGNITRTSSLTNRSCRNARRTILDCSKLRQAIPEHEVINPCNNQRKSKALLLEPTDDESPNLSTLSLLDNTAAKQNSYTLRQSEIVNSKNNCTERNSGDSSETSNETLRRYQHQLSIPFYRQPSISRRRRTSIVEDSLPRIVGSICDTDSLFAEFVRISPYEVSLRSQLDARGIVLRRCCQSEPISFSDVYSETALHQCRKIGEGVYGEVFMNKTAHGEIVVLKIIPIEGCIEVNGEPQKKFDEILSEIAIAMELSRLRNDKEFMTCGFVEVKKVRCVQGRYPDNLIDLWELYRENCGTENDHPEIFPDDQLYIVLELANGGQDLEAFTFQNALQSYSAFVQTALTLAVAEHKFQFEHRDLHWGNILLAPTEEKELTFRINSKEVKIPTHGVKATIIDYTLSRMIFDGCCLYNDLSNDNELFSATGDYQFDIYRLMKKSLEDQWERFEPYTNVLWLHYTIDKMISGARYRCSKSKKHRSAIQGMMQLRDELLDYKSASDYVECLN